MSTATITPPSPTGFIAARPYPHYNSLIVCGRRLRSQWEAEAHRFWPDAEVAVINAAGLEKNLAKLRDRAVANDKPLVAIMTYQTVAKHVDHLREFYALDGDSKSDDLVVDEAVVLKNPNSGRSQALWTLRGVFQRGVALTGTPIEKDLDDMGSILAWVRDDRTMFHGIRLTTRFDVTKETGPGSVEALWQALGPIVFRRDRSEISDELPKIQVETVLVDPEPAELKLAEAARVHLREILNDLTARIEELAEADKDDPRIAKVRETLKSLRGAALGGVTLARMAASDPMAVKESESAGAKLLASKGLVEPAVKTGGTKRELIVGLTEELVDNDEAVLIFTEFATLADHLVSDLKAAGVRVGCIKGGMTDKAADDAQAGFQGGTGANIGKDVKYDVLVLTKAAKEGLNLQRASVLINYELPWLPSDLVQRIGRASRIGSTADTLQVINPVMAGTIEVRAAKKLVQRGMTQLAALDNPRGVKAADTETGLALSGLVDAVSDEIVEDHEEGLLAMARDLIG